MGKWENSSPKIHVQGLVPANVPIIPGTHVLMEDVPVKTGEGQGWENPRLLDQLLETSGCQVTIEGRGSLPFLHHYPFLK